MRILRIFILVLALNMPLDVYGIRPTDDISLYHAESFMKTLAVEEPSLEYNIIVNRNVDVQSLSQIQLKAIFSANLRYWQDGRKIVIVVMSEKNPLHQRFTKSVLGVPSQILDARRNRITQIFRSPIKIKEVDSMREMFEVVSRTPDSIGYLPSKVRIFESDPVKIIEVKKRK